MRRRIITLSVVICLIVSMASYSALAASGTVPFSTSSRTKLVSVTNNTDYTKTLSAWATLTSGTGGAYVEICNSTGSTVYKRGLFPFYNQSVPHVNCNVNPDVTRAIYIKPYTTGQTVTGTLHYTF